MIQQPQVGLKGCVVGTGHRSARRDGKPGLSSRFLQEEIVKKGSQSSAA
jgi:hypothetical protein